MVQSKQLILFNKFLFENYKMSSINEKKGINSLINGVFLVVVSHCISGYN